VKLARLRLPVFVSGGIVARSDSVSNVRSSLKNYAQHFPLARVDIQFLGELFKNIWAAVLPVLSAFNRLQLRRRS
jgi:hypothetical protein